MDLGCSYKMMEKKKNTVDLKKSYEKEEEEVVVVVVVVVEVHLQVGELLGLCFCLLIFLSVFGQ